MPPSSRFYPLQKKVTYDVSLFDEHHQLNDVINNIKQALLSTPYHQKALTAITDETLQTVITETTEDTYQSITWRASQSLFIFLMLTSGFALKYLPIYAHDEALKAQLTKDIANGTCQPRMTAKYHHTYYVNAHTGDICHQPMSMYAAPIMQMLTQIMFVGITTSYGDVYTNFDSKKAANHQQRIALKHKAIEEITTSDYKKILSEQPQSSYYTQWMMVTAVIRQHTQLILNLAFWLLMTEWLSDTSLSTPANTNAWSFSLRTMIGAITTLCTLASLFHKLYEQHQTFHIDKHLIDPLIDQFCLQHKFIPTTQDWSVSYGEKTLRVAFLSALLAQSSVELNTIVQYMREKNPTHQNLMHLRVIRTQYDALKHNILDDLNQQKLCQKSFLPSLSFLYQDTKHTLKKQFKAMILLIEQNDLNHDLRGHVNWLREHYPQNLIYQKIIQNIDKLRCYQQQLQPEQSRNPSHRAQLTPR